MSVSILPTLKVKSIPNLRNFFLLSKTHILMMSVN